MLYIYLVIYWQKEDRTIVELKVSSRMPHYLRMLKYVSQPYPDWGPARKEDQYDRYERKTREIETSDDFQIVELNKTHVNQVFNDE